MSSSYIVFLEAPSARQLKEHPDATYTWKRTSSSLGKETQSPTTVDSAATDDCIVHCFVQTVKRKELESDDARNPRPCASNVTVSVELKEGGSETVEGNSTFPSKDPPEANCHETCQVEHASTVILNEDEDDVDSWILSPEKISVASERLSQMYKGVIFEEDEEEAEDIWDEMDSESKILDEMTRSHDGGTVLSWPPTNPAQNASVAEVEISFLREHSATYSDGRTRRLSRRQSYSRDQTTFLTQDTASYAHSYMQSCFVDSASSIMLLPTYRINLHSLESLSALMSISPVAKMSSGKWSRKVNLLVATLEVEGPELIRIKNGPDAGKEICVLKLIVGEPGGGTRNCSTEEFVRADGDTAGLGPVCRLTAWRETAEVWAGESGVERVTGVAVKRGDVVYIENVLFSHSPQLNQGTVPPNRNPIPPQSLTASPRLDSRILVCFRTLPSVRSDKALRPDLRLGASDPGVRRVADLVRWMEMVFHSEPK